MIIIIINVQEIFLSAEPCITINYNGDLFNTIYSILKCKLKLNTVIQSIFVK